MTTPRPEAAPLNTSGLDAQVSEQLRQWILDGTWADGTRVLEVNVAETLGVSRGPVRDALKRLAEEGLVEIVPRRGAYVRWVPQEDLQEVVRIRQSLEAVALSLAMARDFTGLCDQLGETVDAMWAASRASSWEGILQSEIRFHDLIYTCSQSRRLVQMWSHMKPTVINSFRNDRAYYAEAAQVAKSHEVLLEEIRTEREDLATAELCAHIEPSGDRLPAQALSRGPEDRG